MILQCGWSQQPAGPLSYDAVRLVDGQRLGQAEAAAALALQQRIDLAKDPHLPPTTEAELRALMADDATEYARHERIVAFDGGEAAAIGHVALTDDPNNPELAEITITAEDIDGPAVAPLLAAVLERARADGRTSVIVEDDHTPERHRFWTGLGAELRYSEQESDLDLTAVDPGLMERWMATGPRDLHLARWTGPCPDRWIGTLVAITNAMNDAPTDDLDMVDYEVDAAMVQAEIAARAVCGLDYKVILALGPDRIDPAGATEVFVNRHRPQCSWQWSTVVLAPHRGQGIAKRLKAEMWRWLRDDEPQVTGLRTGNAHSNAAMLAINTDMGFRPTHSTGTWQAPLNTLMSALTPASDPTT